MLSKQSLTKNQMGSRVKPSRTNPGLSKKSEEIRVFHHPPRGTHSQAPGLGHCAKCRAPPRGLVGEGMGLGRPDLGETKRPGIWMAVGQK